MTEPGNEGPGREPGCEPETTSRRYRWIYGIRPAPPRGTTQVERPETRVPGLA